MDEDCRVRWRAADALGQLRDDRAAEPLINALNDMEPRVRQSAAAAIRSLAEGAIAPLSRP
ncbi:MAG: HEAT repeat domain-containing protein [Halobacteriota archaeon]